eukprot:gene7470-546_t
MELLPQQPFDAQSEAGTEQTEVSRFYPNRFLNWIFYHDFPLHKNDLRSNLIRRNMIARYFSEYLFNTLADSLPSFQDFLEFIFHHYKNDTSILSDILMAMIEASSHLQEEVGLSRVNLFFDVKWLDHIPTLLELLDEGFSNDPNGYIAREIVPLISSIIFHTGPASDLFFEKERTVEILLKIAKSHNLGRSLAAIVLARLYGECADIAREILICEDDLKRCIACSLSGNSFEDREFGCGPICVAFSRIACHEFVRERFEDQLPNFIEILRYNRWEERMFTIDYYRLAQGACCRILRNFSVELSRKQDLFELAHKVVTAVLELEDTEDSLSETDFHLLVEARRTLRLFDRLQIMSSTS